MPQFPAEFRFEGIDGRGKQILLRDPNSNRGVAIVRLEDPKGGSEGYTFDLIWKGANGAPSAGYGNNSNRPNWSGGGSGWGGSGNPNSGSGWGGSGGSGGSGWGGSGNSGDWGGGPWNGDIRYRDRGDGSFRNNRGVNDRLTDLDLTINNGSVTVSFATDSGARPTLTGRVSRVSGDLVYADVSGNGISGNIMFRVENRRRVREVSMDGNGSVSFTLRWRN